MLFIQHLGLRIGGKKTLPQEKVFVSPPSPEPQVLYEKHVLRIGGKSMCSG